MLDIFYSVLAVAFLSPPVLALAYCVVAVFIARKKSPACRLSHTTPTLPPRNPRCEHCGKPLVPLGYYGSFCEECESSPRAPAVYDATQEAMVGGRASYTLSPAAVAALDDTLPYPVKGH